MTPAPALTPRQAECLRLIADSLRRRQRPPTFRELALALGVGGPNAVAVLLAPLIRKGYVTRDADQVGAACPYRLAGVRVELAYDDTEAGRAARLAIEGGEAPPLMTTSTRPWTRKQINELLSLRAAGLTHVEVARRLGRTLAAVVKVWQRHGRPRPLRSVSPRVREAVRRLHGQGLTDPEVARRLGLTVNHVSYQRRRLGLPGNHYGPRHREALRRGARRRAAREQITWGQAWAERGRVEAARLGWPGAGSVAQARALDLLWERGPLTRGQLAAALGRTTHPTRALLATLCRDGFVEPAGHSPGGRGPAPRLYRLAPGVKPRRPL